MNRLLIANVGTAKALIGSGFIVIDIIKHISDDKRTAFIFEDTEVIREFIKNKKLRYNDETKGR